MPYVYVTNYATLNVGFKTGSSERFKSSSFLNTFTTFLVAYFDSDSKLANYIDSSKSETLFVNGDFYNFLAGAKIYLTF